MSLSHCWHSHIAVVLDNEVCEWTLIKDMIIHRLITCMEGVTGKAEAEGCFH